MMHQLRIRLLIGALALAVLTLAHAHRDDLLQLALIPTLANHCDGSAPSWLTEVVAWSKRHDLPGIQIHLRTNRKQTDCAFGASFSERGLEERMSTNAILPYASLSKVATSTLAIMQIQRHQLDRKASIYDLLNLKNYALADEDAWRNITIESLLLHRGGFDREASGDPMFWSTPPCPDNLDSLNRVKIDFPAGTRYAYSNLGYCLIGLALTHAGYESPTAAFESVPSLSDRSIRVTDAADLHSSGTFLRFATEEERERFSQLDWPVHLWTGKLAGTARDYGIFLETLSSSANTSLNQAGKEMLSPLPKCNDSAWRSCHGLAFYSHVERGGERMFWRDGSLPGVTAFAAITVSGNTFVLLANSRDPEWIAAHDELGRIVYENLAKTIR